ncbi:MAG: prenyltransferase/squalene oxidase repeat-containing protein, partial [Dehalococcoidia bacterium]
PGIAATAYDTAWMASVPSAKDPRQPRFPLALLWLRSHQHADGSWGGAVRYEHDRLLSTLAALPAMATFQRSPQDAKRVERGTRYVWQHQHLLSGEHTELVGFEVLLPALLERARKAGIPTPPYRDVYGGERAEKLKLIPPDALYSPQTTISHSLEFLGDAADVQGLRAAQAANGSIGNSPAATAFFLSLTGDRAAEAYLSETLGLHGNEAAPVLHPCEIFELTWAAYQLHLAGVPASSLLTDLQVEHFKNALAHGGVTLSPSFPIPDADETSVVLVLLRDLGVPVDPSVLERFVTKAGHFASFPFERHSSVGVNLHVLHAMLRVPGFTERDATVRRLLEYVRDERSHGLYWHDKWHASPYYATSHALCILELLPRELARLINCELESAREWLRNTQNGDGSWGFYGQSTLEETAYAVLGLAAPYPNIPAGDLERCRAGMENIQARITAAGGLCDALLPPLWIDKCLYTPTLVAKAAVHAAMVRTAEMGIGQG